MRCRCHSSCRRSRFSQLGTQICGKRSSSSKLQNQLRILAIRLLLAHPLRCESRPRLRSTTQTATRPAVARTSVRVRWLPCPRAPSFPGREIAVELLRFLAVPSRRSLQLSGFGIHKRNLLEARMIVTSLYLVCICPIRSLCVSGGLDRVSAGGRSLLRRGCSAAWIIDRPPALLSQRRGESQAARACIQGRRERWHRVGEPKLSLIQFCRGSTCL